MPNKVYSDSFNRLNVQVRRNEKSSLGNVVFAGYTVEQINPYLGVFTQYGESQ